MSDSSGTIINIGGTNNNSNLVLSSVGGSINSTEPPIVPDTTPLFGRTIYNSHQKSWLVDDATTTFSVLDYRISDYMLYNLSNPETITYKPALAKSAEIGDYLNYSLIQIDNTLSYADKNAEYERIKAEWAIIVNEAKLNSGFKYEINWFQMNNVSPTDISKLDINLVIVSTTKLSDSIITKINNLDISSNLKSKFIFSIQNSNSSIIYALANGPYGGAVTPLNEIEKTILPFTYVYKKSDALKLDILNNTSLVHGAILLFTHNFVNAPAIETRDGPRLKTNCADIFGFYYEYTGSDNIEYVVYSSIQIFTGDYVSGLNGHIIAPIPSATLEIKNNGNLLDSLRSDVFLYAPVFAGLLAEEVVTDTGLSSINQFSALVKNPSLNYNLPNITNISNYTVTTSFVNLWNKLNSKYINANIGNVKRLMETGFYTANGMTDYFFPVIELGDPFTTQMFSYLLTYNETFTGDLVGLNVVSGTNATLAKLISNGFITAS